jgi:hypothetical protein
MHTSNQLLVFTLVCQCNQTLNLLSRPEYFRLESNVENDQLRLANLFTPPHVVSLARKQLIVPTLTLTLVKGPIDLMSIQAGDTSSEFIAYITSSVPSGQSTVESIKSKQGRIERCLLRVESVKFEFFKLPISNSQQDIPINLTTCEHTLRTYPSQKHTNSNFDSFFSM